MFKATRSLLLIGNVCGQRSRDKIEILKPKVYAAPELEASPVATSKVEQAEHFWFFDSYKAIDNLGFAPRDPQATLNDTIEYLQTNILGKGAFT